MKTGQFLNVQSVTAPDIEQCPVFVKEITQPLSFYCENLKLASGGEKFESNSFVSMKLCG